MDNDSFFSIDRLVEFGMGMAMAQQMVGMMNQTMRQMYVPGSIQTMPAAQPVTFYVAINGQPVGPISESEFTQMVTNKQITKDTLAWMPGMLAWKPIELIPAILKVIAVAPPPIP
jgi:hypothetical protein